MTPGPASGYVSPATRRPLLADPARGGLTTADGREWFPLLAGDVPDLRVEGDRLPAQAVADLDARLDAAWAAAERRGAPPVQDVQPVPWAARLRERLATARAELTAFARYTLRPQPWTQADSARLYRDLTPVYPDALATPVRMVQGGRVCATSLARFKELALGPLLALLHEQRVGSVLDFGCGWGASAIVLRRALPALELAAFDAVPQRVLSARFNLARLGLSGTALFVADGSRLPLGDDAVDLVFTSHVLEQMQEVLDPALAEIHRVARRWAVLMEPTWRHAGWVQRLRVIRKGYPRDILERCAGLAWAVREARPAEPTWAPTPAEWIVLEKVR